ncbi:MAG TPA: glycine--tRNA ligase subunit beta, partial [Rhodanobacteraceae bacterium]
MSEPKSLLIEIGCEELPIRTIDELARAFAEGVMNGLAQRGIPFQSGTRAFCTPRRLAVHVPAVGDSQPEQHSEALGPYVNAALDA